MNSSPTPVRQRLLDAARDLFAQHGYDGTSVRAITGRARANLGAITYHFGSKESLYHAVIESVALPLADRIAAIAATSGPPLERLAAVSAALFDHMAQHPEMPSLMVRQLASGRPVPEPVLRVIRRNFESFERIIVAGQADGSIRPGEPRLLAFSVGGHPLFLALAGHAIRAAVGIDPQDPRVRERIVELTMATMLAGLANPTREQTP